MGVEALESNIETDEFGDDAFDDEASESNSKIVGVDARRRLENKLEDIRLQKELRDYDFDI